MKADSGRAAVVACIDGSSYLDSVCDHAAWVATQIGGGVELLHVSEGTKPAGPEVKGGGAGLRARGQGSSSGDPVMRDAVARLVDEGADVLELFSADGQFAALAEKVSRQAEFMVVGRRGRAGEARNEGPDGEGLDGEGLGGNVVKLLGSVRTPVFVVPRVKPAHSRALILFDERHPTRGYAEFLASHPALDGLSFDVATITSGDRAQDPRSGVKLRLDTPFTADRADTALEQYFADHECDLIVMPRSVVLDPPDDSGGFFARLTRWRVPILFPPEPSEP